MSLSTPPPPPPLFERGFLCFIRPFFLLQLQTYRNISITSKKGREKRENRRKEVEVERASGKRRKIKTRWPAEKRIFSQLFFFERGSCSALSLSGRISPPFSVRCDACASSAARSGASRQASCGAAEDERAAAGASISKDVGESLDDGDDDDDGNISGLLLSSSLSVSVSSSHQRGRRDHRRRPGGGQRDGREHGHRRREGEHEHERCDDINFDVGVGAFFVVRIRLFPRRDRALGACRRLRLVAAHRGGAPGLGEFFSWRVELWKGAANEGEKKARFFFPSFFFLSLSLSSHLQPPLSLSFSNNNTT